MGERSDVLVVGGGAIGVCTALSLAERGVGVALVERGEIASGCSYGNAGWIFPGHSVPIPGPGVMRTSIRWLLSRDSPLTIRPRPSPALLRWLLRFWTACREEPMRRATALRRALSLASLARFEALAARPTLEFGFAQCGLVMACATREGMAAAERERALVEELGGAAELLDAASLRDRVPALRADVVGGLLLPEDAIVDPAAFVRAVAAEAERSGARLHDRTEVLDLDWTRRSGPTVVTTRGELAADEVVLAAGSWSPGLARRLRVRVPIEPAKGYSITVRRPAEFGDLPVMLSEARVGVTPLGDRLRFAGTLELAGLDLAVNLRRVGAIERAARAWLPGLPETEHLETWRGLRPLTHDDQPHRGRPRETAGLVLATGHGMKGISQAPATGELVAQLLCGEPPEVDLTPFSPDRF